ncbi:family 43 glycosylhydrolase [Chitinophaga sp. 22321]|uniref:Family 43 glycosylhydrolase n=1 Tax=Chitinophaga hostae TaxID=2831022 RepID=A0ABS5IY99_9BACT|nr:family 43 glycosylhydrolase [Chitinophaga hostae]MBS0027192.1 family 43 glycosylhydrolase [Chitinophaga hostae]
MCKKFLVIALLFLSRLLYAQQSDNEDGTYTNPVIWADFPDNDVIRVGDTYYMVTTTMYFFPGVPVLKSKDLVNWEYAANVVPQFKQHPFYDLKGGSRYGRGQWASSIRYHNGKFHILFMTLDEGGFLCTATKAEGPWEIRKLPRPYYDAGLFFDDNGRIYIAHGYSKISITEVDANLAPISPDSIVFDKVQRPGLEGSHVYKINGYYYIYATYGGGDGYQVCLRSRNIYGPYEEKVVLKDDMNLSGKGIHQGALIETPEGEWWSIIFQDRAGVGRVPTLQPAHWVDGWPILGENGRAVVTYKKPTAAVSPVRVLPTSDEFNRDQLAVQWAWNHNPDDGAWSLTKRKGYLRLTTGSIAADLPHARNSLTQRIFGPFSDATTALDISQMKEGDVTGLAVLQMPHAFIGVRAGAHEKFIVMELAGNTVDSVAIGKRSMIFFKASVNTVKDQAHFYYSFDNKTFIPLGDTLNMQFDLKMFTGNRFALFNYATTQTGGYVDLDWFRMDTRQGPPNLFKASSPIQAEMYDEIYQAHVRPGGDVDGPKEQDVANWVDGSWIRFNQVDFEDGYKHLLLRLAPGMGRITVYADGDSLNPYATVTIPEQTGKAYSTVGTPVKPLTGKHRLTFKFTGTAASALRLNWFSFTNSSQQAYVSAPLISHIYTADPSAHLFNGKIYIYPSHDTATKTAESDNGDHFQMADYHILSMDSIGGKVTDHGVGLRAADIPWVSRQLWAPDAAFSQGTYYLYFPAKDKQGVFRIGVATSKQPEGPFVAEKNPVAGTYSIDPAVFRDDDGSFYLYFGGIWGGQLQNWNNNRYDAAAKLRTKEEAAILPRVAKLSPGMKTLAHAPAEIKITDSSGNLFREKDNDKRFFEAAWMHKYQGKYYFSYSTGDTHNIAYAIGDNPYGPFKYQGIILKPVEGWTNHHSIVQIGDRWYLFYHDTQLSGKTHLRNVKVMEMKYNSDGTIQPMSAFSGTN